MDLKRPSTLSSAPPLEPPATVAAASTSSRHGTGDRKTRFLDDASSTAGTNEGRLSQHRQHILEPSDRDPLYDYDHSLAHGSRSISRMRTLSLGQLSDIHSWNVRATGSSEDDMTPVDIAGPMQVQVLATATATSAAARMQNPSAIIEASEKHRRRRRGSHDEKKSTPRQFIIDVESTQRQILEQEDTDRNFQITVSDRGPKVFPLGTLGSRGHHKFEVRGHYALANLLQELALASDYGRKQIVLDEARITENPVDRLSRMIRHHFWDGLTRRIDAAGLELICLDPKNRSANHQPRIYVPATDPEAWDYYLQVAKDKPHLDLDVVKLPHRITPEYVKSINDKPGILSLALRKSISEEGKVSYRGVPFVVPGGRFNEMYGWDSYFETLGLLADGRFELSRSMVDNFVYEIEHYGKILNANRSYYLTRSQPPYLTDMILQVYDRFPAIVEEEKKNLWLLQSIRAAIKEYWQIWMAEPRFVPDTQLSRYHPEGVGVPPETEASHFNAILIPFAEQFGLDIPTFILRYNDREISVPELDEYFIHDRAVRESGHDTTYRLEGKCAHICPFDLNCLLYRYELDIGKVIRNVFHDQFPLADETVESSAPWFERAKKRKELINRFCWNEAKGMFFDYDIHLKKMSEYESVTTFYALWSGIATPEQASRIVDVGLKKFEAQGGLVSGTEASRGEITLSRPNRQWDYPYGWAPLQIVAWRGLCDYGYQDVAKRLAYRWLFMITKSFVDFNGVVPEKFDVVTLNHKVNVEYGNVGIDFKFIPREGFGWMNSSYEVGLTYMNSHMRRALGTLVHPDAFFSKTPRYSPVAAQTSLEDEEGGKPSRKSC